nr:MAG TPA: hypothetical protein [Caudoviricetes sp.]
MCYPSWESRYGSPFKICKQIYRPPSLLLNVSSLLYFIILYIVVTSRLKYHVTLLSC